MCANGSGYYPSIARVLDSCWRALPEGQRKTFSDGRRAVLVWRNGELTPTLLENLSASEIRSILPRRVS